MPPAPDPTTVQLSLIHELSTALRSVGIPHWLFGGWVVDFLAGEITRPHSDVDLMIWRKDVAQFHHIVQELGYTECPSPSGPELDARFSKHSQLVEIMFLKEQENGGAAWGDWHLPPDTLETQHGRLGEIVCPILNPALLLSCKEECARQESDPAEQMKHREDVARLRSLLAPLGPL